MGGLGAGLCLQLSPCRWVCATRQSSGHWKCHIAVGGGERGAAKGFACPWLFMCLCNDSLLKWHRTPGRQWLAAAQTHPTPSPGESNCRALVNPLSLSQQ